MRIRFLHAAQVRTQYFQFVAAEVRTGIAGEVIQTDLEGVRIRRVRDTERRASGPDFRFFVIDHVFRVVQNVVAVNVDERMRPNGKARAVHFNNFAGFAARL